MRKAVLRQPFVVPPPASRQRVTAAAASCGPCHCRSGIRDGGHEGQLGIWGLIDQPVALIPAGWPTSLCPQHPARNGLPRIRICCSCLRSVWTSDLGPLPVSIFTDLPQPQRQQSHTATLIRSVIRFISSKNCHSNKTAKRLSRGVILGPKRN